MHVRSLMLLALIFTSATRAQNVVSTTQTTGAGARTGTINLHLESVPLSAALDEIARQGGVQIGYRFNVVSGKPRVTITGEKLTITAALRQVLVGTGLEAVASQAGGFAIREKDSRSQAQGTISGKVIDSKNGKGIAGATVSLGNTRGVVTDEDGLYRLVGVASGTQVVTVRLVGYAKQAKSITVSDGVGITVDFNLEPSASVLDQVVVTGTVVSTELKAVPSAITVITAKQIEERGISRIDQLFRGEIPGLFAQNTGSTDSLGQVRMFSRGATTLSSTSSGTFLNTNAIKTYVDGIELADPTYLSQIDPKSIERIEILTGPQASTIYGSNALNGVMQIFTKRGNNPRPQLAISALSGFIQNNFSNALTSKHDYNAQLSGIEGRLSYNAGASWKYTGPWTPAVRTTQAGGFGGARFVFPAISGRLVADMTFRSGNSSNKKNSTFDQLLSEYIATGYYSLPSITSLAVARPTTLVTKGRTSGLTIGYSPASWWSNELGFGSDVTGTERRATARSYSTFSDSSLRLDETYTSRVSMRYTTTVQASLASFWQANVTLGADSWRNLATSLSLSPQVLTGTLTGVPTLSRRPGHNTGGFVQTQFAFKDRFFLTYGLRAEWNPDFGEDELPNYAPRYGVAYTQNIGSLTAKLRASYGRSTRPPKPTYHEAMKASKAGLSDYVPTYGDFDILFASPGLTPEYQQGGEGGLELYLGTRGSIVVTRYNQTVDRIIYAVTVDSARSLAPCTPAEIAAFLCFSRDAAGYGYILQSMYINLGSIRNQGWELQGNMNLGPFSGRGTYSWTKSRTLGVDPKWKSFFTPSSYPQFQPGATFEYLPEHTWATGITYARAKSSISLDVTGLGQTKIIAGSTELSSNYLTSSIRLPQNKLRMDLGVGGFQGIADGYAMANVIVTHGFSANMDGVLQIQNLGDTYRGDRSYRDAAIGRQINFGTRIRW